MFPSDVAWPRRRVVSAILLALAALSSAACRRDPGPDPRVVSEYVHLLYGAIRVERLSPPVASRLTAYASMALYGGTAAARPSLRPLGEIVRGVSLPAPVAPSSVDATLTAVAAERVVLDSLLREALPTTRAAFTRLADSLQAVRVAAGVAPDVVARSDSAGRAIGAAIVAWSGTDGFRETRTMAYAPALGDSLWINDAPPTVYATQSMSAVSELVLPDNPANQQRTANMGDRSLILSRPKTVGDKTLPAANMAGITEPYWGRVRGFVVSDTTTCPGGTAPAWGRDSSAALVRQAHAVYDASRALTDEQRTIAYYWADNAGETGTPVGHWLAIAAQMIGERQLDGDAAVRLVLATALAQADAFIAAWRVKFATMTLRPRTVIRRMIDSTWEPLIPTPPFPEYPSGHSTQSSAAAAAITAQLGDTPFSDSTSITLGHAVRRFPSFRAASEEAGMSRVYAGLHYMHSNIGGLGLGRCIGERVAAAVGAPPVVAAR
ncbi:MAG: vanadium-dependent haloperoxidase [Gemmatimonadetes bacterium]|nr:vanadium-dependent haloperoxidase [Gemmatimonadota bacterium]